MTQLCAAINTRPDCTVNGSENGEHHYMSPPDKLALDLEGTLISNAMSCFPRPGLRAFLDFAALHFPRIVLFTAVAEHRVRPILDVLAGEGDVPAWMAGIEIIGWSGEVKDLGCIPRACLSSTLLVDDLESYVHPDQRAQWIAIEPFSAPYPDTDRELDRVAAVLRHRLQGALGQM